MSTRNAFAQKITPKKYEITAQVIIVPIVLDKNCIAAIEKQRNVVSISTGAQTLYRISHDSIE